MTRVKINKEKYMTKQETFNYMTLYGKLVNASEHVMKHRCTYKLSNKSARKN